MIRLYFVPLVFLGVAHAVIAGPDQQERAIDTQRSSLTVHVRKAGLLSAAAHEHWVNAPITSGSVDDSGATPGSRFTVDARRLSVSPEKGVSDRDQAEVQSNMQNKVLESSTYPEIVFHSMQIRRTSDLVWRVSGDLTLHGTTRPVIAEVTRQDDAYVGTARIRQTEFGIRLIKIGGGVVKVMDELDISIRLYTVPPIQP